MRMTSVLGRCSLSFLALSRILLCAQDASEWPKYGRDPGGTKYSPLDQINTKNVSTLVRAWSYHTGEPGAYLGEHSYRSWQRHVLRHPEESRRGIGAGNRQGTLDV